MNDERIIKYIENELSSSERIAFEADLNNSVSLKTELEKFLKVKLQTDELKKIKLSQDFLSSVIPEFRDRVNIRKSSAMRKNLGYAFVVMFFFILVIFGLKNFFLHDAQQSDIHKFAQSLDDSQRVELLEKLESRSGDIDLLPEIISGNELTDLLSSELELNAEIVEVYDISNDDLLSGLTQNEFDKIYTELLNKNF